MSDARPFAASGGDEDDEDDRPWERFGRQRLDFEPHRAGIVRFLGMMSLVMGAGSLCGGVPAILGLPTGVACLLMCHLDLNKMRSGLMDRRGEARTRSASETALCGVGLSAFNLVIWAMFLLDQLR